jgi:chromosome segregation ATPase
MRKIIFVLAVFSFFASCTSRSEYEKLEAQRDSLLALTENKDGTINDLFESFNSIEENLELIKEKENIIRVNSSGETGVEENMKDRINEDINAIYELMLKNKKELETVKSKMRNSGIKVKELDRMVQTLTQQMESKNNEIVRLTEKLKEMDIVVGELKSEVTDLSENVDSLSVENKIKENIIEEKTTALNTAYYAVGTKDELIKHQILTKEGLLGNKTKLLSDFNKSYFTTIDITKVTKIPIMASKVTVLTTHPSSSYQLKGTEKVEELIILDAEKFWSVSKYLVIQTR